MVPVRYELNFYVILKNQFLQVNVQFVFKFPCT
jgi:hypothetical protein